MRYPILHYLGGFIWWIFIKFCKTDLEIEQGENNRVRNILFSLSIGIILGFLFTKLF